MLRKCNKFLAFLLAFALVITAFKSDFATAKVYAEVEAEGSIFEQATLAEATVGDAGALLTDEVGEPTGNETSGEVLAGTRAAAVQEVPEGQTPEGQTPEGEGTGEGQKTEGQEGEGQETEAQEAKTRGTEGQTNGTQEETDPAAAPAEGENSLPTEAVEIEGASITYYSDDTENAVKKPYPVELAEDAEVRTHTLLGYEEATGVTLPSDKKFLGWSIDGVTKAVGDPVTFEEDQKIDAYPVFEGVVAVPETVHITFKGYYYSKNILEAGNVELGDGLDVSTATPVSFDALKKYAKGFTEMNSEDYSLVGIYDDTTFKTRDYKTTPLVEDTTLYVKYNKDDSTRVGYFLLKKSVAKLKYPEPDGQPVGEYYPNKNNEYNSKYIWTGTVNDINDIEVDYTKPNGYRSLYNWPNAISQEYVGYTFDDGVIGKINTYLAGEYGSDFNSDDIIWYVYKRHTDGNHIDGYVSSHATYHASLPASQVSGGNVSSDTYEDVKVRFNTEKDVLKNMFTPVDSEIKFLGWSTTPGATTPDPEYTVEKLNEGTQYVVLDHKAHFYAVWDVPEYKYKLIIQVDAQGRDKDTTLKYDGNVHYGAVNVKVTAELIKKESAKAVTDTGIQTASLADKLRRTFGNVLSDALSIGTIKAYAAEHAGKVTPVEAKEITLDDGTVVVVDGLKTIADPGVDVGDYPVNLDYSGMTITRKSDGANVKDLFIVEIEGKNVSESNVAAATKPTEEIAQLHILKRNVILTSATDSKVWDGTPLTNHGMTTGGDGFANGADYGQEGADVNVTGSQTAIGSSPNTFTYTLRSNTKLSNYNIYTNVGTLTVTPINYEDNPPPEDNPPTDNPPAPGVQGAVLGARRDVAPAANGAAVLGARRGRTEDDANTLGRIITIIFAAGIGFTMIFIKRKKNEEN